MNESYDDDRGIMKASVQLRVAYSQRHNLVAAICGTRMNWPKGAAGAVPRAFTASIVPVETPSTIEAAVTNGLIAYDEAIVTVNFTTEIKDVASESIEPYTEFITLDHHNFAWGSGNGPMLKEEEAPGKLIRGINFVRTEYDQTTLAPELLSLMGHVNNAPITGSILALTFPTETLLYAPPVITYKQDSTNINKFEVVKKFTYSQNGWNVYFRGATNAYTAIYKRGSGAQYKSYPVASLSPLFP